MTRSGSSKRQEFPPVRRGCCSKHFLVPVEATCDRCDEEFCDRCVLEIPGRRARVLCLDCAFDAAGVRTVALARR